MKAPEGARQISKLVFPQLDAAMIGCSLMSPESVGAVESFSAARALNRSRTKVFRFDVPP